MLSELFSTVAFCCTIVLFIIPYWDVKEIYKTKETSKFPYLLFINFAIQCYAWFWYGIGINSTSVYLCNLVGLIANTGYIIVFTLSTNLSDQYKKGIISFICLLLVVLFSISIMITIPIRVYGIVAVVFNSLALFSSGQKIKDAIDKEDNSFIPIRIIIIVLFNSAFWIAYAITIGFDLFIIIPNMIGIIMATIQIYLFKKYDKTNETDAMINNIKSRLGLNTPDL